MLGSDPAMLLGGTGEKWSYGTYQAQHEIKSDGLELFSLRKQNGRYLIDFLSCTLCRALGLSATASAMDGTDCGN